MSGIDSPSGSSGNDFHQEQIFLLQRVDVGLGALIDWSEVGVTVWRNILEYVAKNKLSQRTIPAPIRPHIGGLKLQYLDDASARFEVFRFLAVMTTMDLRMGEQGNFSGGVMATYGTSWPSK